MIEKIVENWLDKCSERSLQLPFCHILRSDGHTIVHLTRHCGIEFGIDIITVDRDGTPCAFQLKVPSGGRLTLTQWRTIEPQVSELVTGRIVHPSVRSNRAHKSYLVVNGTIDEEVSRRIDDLKIRWAKPDGRDLQFATMVKGEILERACRLGTDLWPTEVKDIQTVLRLHLLTGREPLPSDEVARLLEVTFGLTTEVAKKRKAAIREISAAALIMAIALSPFTRSGNHVAEIKGWVLFGAYLLAVASRDRLAARHWRHELLLAMDYIRIRLLNLAEEVEHRKSFMEPGGLADAFLLQIRRTIVTGFLAVLGLWIKLDPKAFRTTEGLESRTIEPAVQTFCLKNRTKLYLWGEAGVPQFLAVYWYTRLVDPTYKPEIWLGDLIRALCRSNHPTSKHVLASPYYDETAFLKAALLGDASTWESDDFAGRSRTVEPLFHLLVRRNWKQMAKALWPEVSYLSVVRFECEKKWHFFRWKNPGHGREHEELPSPTQEWQALRVKSLKNETDSLPEIALKFPIFVLLFLIVYPHRVRTDLVRWLDGQLENL